jgi:hypothetical protein
MSLEFMSGGVLLNLLQLLLTFGTLLVFYLLCSSWIKDTYTNRERVSLLFIGVGLVLFHVFILSSATQPKMAIDVPAEDSLIDYQRNSEVPEIVTPDPRTDRLDGFTPLKKE